MIRKASASGASASGATVVTAEPLPPVSTTGGPVSSKADISMATAVSPSASRRFASSDSKSRICSCVQPVGWPVPGTSSRSIRFGSRSESLWPPPKFHSLRGSLTQRMPPSTSSPPKSWLDMQTAMSHDRIVSGVGSPRAAFETSAVTVLAPGSPSRMMLLSSRNAFWRQDSSVFSPREGISALYQPSMITA